MSAEGGGIWGGSCTCPDGKIYQVGDEANFCKSLTCIGGIAGKCNKAVGPWTHRKVTCGIKIKMPASPQLWVIEQKGGEVAGKLNLRETEGVETCVATAYTKGPLCFEIHEQDDDEVVAEGCLREHLVQMGVGWRKVHLSGGWELTFHVPLLVPPSPPTPPDSPPPPLPPRSPQSPSQPPLPPASPPMLPPWQQWSGNLDSLKCDAMLRDPKHPFRKMWAAEAWGVMGAGASILCRARAMSYCVLKG
mgnify:CR=1 FL=1